MRFDNRKKKGVTTLNRDERETIMAKREISINPFTVTIRGEEIFPGCYERDRTETRYAIYDEETGELLDDAQGYGYKSRKKAYAAWAYKHRDRAKEAEKKKRAREIIVWQKPYGLFKTLDQYAFEIAKGSWGPDDKVDTKMVEELCKDIEDVPYAYKDISWTWRYGRELLTRKQ